MSSSPNPVFMPGDEVVLTVWRLGEAPFGLFRPEGAGEGVDAGRAAARTDPSAGDGHRHRRLYRYARGDCAGTHGLQPGDGEVLVTGAAGGVGSVAMAILAKLGHRWRLRPDAAEHDYLRGLGAAAMIDRAELSRSRPSVARRALGRRGGRRRRHDVATVLA